MSLPIGYEDKDIIAVLTDSKVPNDPLVLSNLRDVVVGLNSSTSRTQMQALLKSQFGHLEDGSTDALFTTFLRALPIEPPDSRLSRLKTDDIAMVLLSLIKFFYLFMSKKGNDRVPVVLRPLSDMIDIIIRRAFDMKIVADRKNYVTGERAERERDRYYGFNATIPLPNYETCVLCGHNRIDEPESNQRVLQRNQEAVRDYMLKCAEADARKLTNPDSVRWSQLQFVYFLNYLFIYHL